ncbi:SDR family oxidoreductase (plasmid) [Streptomyces goshikiensis]|uniref:SDR family oxidoreductase n=1 Tax=Streptomyces goshikiensis TaxID=1942 RepID=A0ABZ1RXG4_9ACTN|nr:MULTISPECIES: SDR family oxidoreductase [Streptomyces]AYV32412.1 putative sugar epimerase YhfK [Streptomyces sp. ADI95-16]MBT1188725.1 SDR family oxidoreductase [Streptomyces sp. CJ_13]
MYITVLGATGRTGRIVVERLLAQGHSVRAAVRKSKNAAGLNADLVTFDLTSSDPDRFAAVFAGTDAVINAAATSSMMKKQADLVDRAGVIAAIDAAAALGVKRWIQVSMMGSGESGRVPVYLRAIGQAKHAADTHLAASGMAWTVVRPPWLTDGPAAGLVTVGERVPEGSLTRADLAAVAVECLDATTTHDRMLEVTSGDLPIREALRSLI